jgi:RNA polymerase sigma-70 factor (ECF subfamily)
VGPDAAQTLELLERARHGEPTALEELFARHRGRLRYCIARRLDRRLAARVDVSDVLQETCLEAARRMPDYLRQPGMPFDLWLRWIAREKVLALHRRHLQADKRAVTHEVRLPDATPAAASAGPTPSQALAAAETAGQVRTALERLDADERQILVWRHFEQLTNRAIAERLQISEAAANKRYIRALDRLRGLLADLGLSRPG